MPNKNNCEPESSKGRFLVYRTDDGTLKLDVHFEDESVWLTQQLMAELFQTTKQNISIHIQNIYEEEELLPEATVKKYLTVRSEGNREVKRMLDYYNLHEKAMQKAHEEYKTFRLKQLNKPSEVEKHFIEAEKELKLIESKTKLKSSDRGKKHEDS